MTDFDSADSPLFTIEHELEIPATPEEVWAVLVDFNQYGDWNPYVIAIAGGLSEGSVLEITIEQTNWPQPLTINPTLIRAEARRVLAWRGRVGDGGILDTDHSFQLCEPSSTSGPTSVPGSDERVRFVQREEFRGSLAEKLEDDARKFTWEAFRAMNEALSERVQTLRRRAV